MAPYVGVSIIAGAEALAGHSSPFGYTGNDSMGCTGNDGMGVILKWGRLLELEDQGRMLQGWLLQPPLTYTSSVLKADHNGLQACSLSHQWGSTREWGIGTQVVSALQCMWYSVIDCVSQDPSTMHGIEARGTHSLTQCTGDWHSLLVV